MHPRDGTPASRLLGPRPGRAGGGPGTSAGGGGPRPDAHRAPGPGRGVQPTAARPAGSLRLRDGHADAPADRRNGLRPAGRPGGRGVDALRPRPRGSIGLRRDGAGPAAGPPGRGRMPGRTRAAAPATEASPPTAAPPAAAAPTAAAPTATPPTAEPSTAARPRPPRRRRPADRRRGDGFDSRPATAGRSGGVAARPRPSGDGRARSSAPATGRARSGPVREGVAGRGAPVGRLRAGPLPDGQASGPVPGRRVGPAPVPGWPQPRGAAQTESADPVGRDRPGRLGRLLRRTTDTTRGAGRAARPGRSAAGEEARRQRGQRRHPGLPHDRPEPLGPVDPDREVHGQLDGRCRRRLRCWRGRRRPAEYEVQRAVAHGRAARRRLRRRPARPQTRRPAPAHRPGPVGQVTPRQRTHHRTPHCRVIPRWTNSTDLGGDGVGHGVELGAGPLGRVCRRADPPPHLVTRVVEQQHRDRLPLDRAPRSRPGASPRAWRRPGRASARAPGRSSSRRTGARTR